MRKFYEIFSNQKLTTMLSKLTWSHYLLLLSINNCEEIIYYINISVNLNLTQRQLQDRIRKDEYNRLPIETKNKLINREEVNIKELIPNPIIIKNSNNYEIISEKIIQKLILEDIPSFLDELGEGFTFVRNEYKIKLGDKYNYIDLLLYNIRFKCYVVVELKITELKKEHIGQIQIYMNYIDKNIKTIDENKTIGIINKRQLHERIKNKEYERLSIETKSKLMKNEQLKVNNLDDFLLQY